MESNNNCSTLDFGFAFDDNNFSDRVLRIEIEHDDKTEISSMDITLANWIRRRKEERKKKKKKKGELPWNIEVKTVHISSPILAAKSPFFLKLFSNGMKESEERIATLRIHSSEEVALMDLLNFMYKNTLSSSTTSSLMDVLMIADKFQVSSCIIYCIKLLCELPMTCESALQFLHLPSSVMMADEVRPLTDAAKKYFAHRYKDFTRFQHVLKYPLAPIEENLSRDDFTSENVFVRLVEVINLPLAAIESILSNDDLDVSSEDVVYEFVLKWARKHYPVIEERREILTTRLSSLIRYENMTSRKLKEILSCDDFDPAYASKVVLEAFIFKEESTHFHTFHASSRRCTFRPVKVLEFMYPHPHCVVYLDLKKEDCNNLLPLQWVTSEDFCLGEKWFYLSVLRMSSDSFGLFLSMKQFSPCLVAYEFSARSKPTMKFERKFAAGYKFSVGGLGCIGSSNLLGVSWSQFIAPDSIYFINEVLYLKAEIAIGP